MIGEIIGRIEELKRQAESLEQTIGAAIIATIMEVASDSPVRMKRIGEHCFTIRFSDLIGKPWSPKFYDWRASGDELIKYLEKTHKSPIKWIDDLKELKAENGIVRLTFTHGSGEWRATTQVPIDARIVERVLERL